MQNLKLQLAEKMATDLGKIKGVTCVALGGSLARGAGD